MIGYSADHFPFELWRIATTNTETWLSTAQIRFDVEAIFSSQDIEPTERFNLICEKLAALQRAVDFVTARANLARAYIDPGQSDREAPDWFVEQAEEFIKDQDCSDALASAYNFLRFDCPTDMPEGELVRNLKSGVGVRWSLGATRVSCDFSASAMKYPGVDMRVLVIDNEESKLSTHIFRSAPAAGKFLANILRGE